MTDNLFDLVWWFIINHRWCNRSYFHAVVLTRCVNFVGQNSVRGAACGLPWNSIRGEMEPARTVCARHSCNRRSRPARGRRARRVKGDFADHDGWYDDVSDGSINAAVRMNDGSVPVVIGAWAVASPKYAPGLRTVVTPFDTLERSAVDRNLMQSRVSDPQFLGRMFAHASCAGPLKHHASERRQRL